jgi:hypothetical protein
MRILLAGDTHGGGRHALYLRAVAYKKECKLIIQLGDFGYLWRGQNIAHIWSDYSSKIPAVPVWFLPGNHEDWNQLDEYVEAHPEIGSDRFQWMQVAKGVRYLGRVKRLLFGNTRILCVGGAISVDRSHRLENVTYFRREAISEADIQRAVEGGPCDILLSHDAPSTSKLQAFIGQNGWVGSKAVSDSMLNRAALESIIDVVRPRLVVHGHYHHRYSAKWGDVKVEGLAQDQTGVDSWLIIETDDWARSAAS